ncbi:WD40 repeat domain-containing protein [Paenibacillus sp. FSL W8-0186]|uniref:WD40 repeat domain-containing protein n=1 Tax=Paenibacillus sp. FSL W8-0186 TaxID=2921709 RepID=UPI0030D2C9BA
MLFIEQKINRATKNNARGSFIQTVRLFAKYTKKDWLSLTSKQSWLTRMKAFYLYIEALLYSEQVEKVENQYFELFKNIYTRGCDTYGYDKTASLLLQLVEGSLAVFQQYVDPGKVMRTFGPLLESGRLKPEIIFKMTYYMALANVKDGNLVDAKAKLSSGLETKEPFWNSKWQELCCTVEELLDPGTGAMKANNSLFEEIAHGQRWIGDTALSPDGSLTAVMYMGGLLKIFKTESGEEIFVCTDHVLLFEEEKATHMRLAFSPDGCFLTLGLGVGIVKIYDMKLFKLHAEYHLPGLFWEDIEPNAYYKEYTYVQFSPFQKYMVVVPTAENYDPQGDNGYPIPEQYGTFYIIDFSTGDVVFEHTYKDRKIGAVSFSPDEQLFAVALLGEEVDIWKIQSQSLIFTSNDFVWLGLSDRVGMTQTLSFSAQSDRLVYAAKENRLVVVKLFQPDAIYSIDLGGNYKACALHVDSQDHIIAVKYISNRPVILCKWKMSDFKEEVLFTGGTYAVKELLVDEDHDELWLFDTSIAELRKYSTGSLVRKWDPYGWWYSYSVIFSSISISSQVGMVAISHKEAVRIGRSERELS